MAVVRDVEDSDDDYQEEGVDDRTFGHESQFRKRDITIVFVENEICLSPQHCGAAPRLHSHQFSTSIWDAIVDGLI
jgi:hypothetical protein